MSQHTPAPWILGNENNYCCDVDCGDGRTRISFDRMDALGLCECHITREEMLANAHLVAAAPELLAACDRALADPQFLMLAHETSSAIVAAIAKTRGGR